MAPHMLQRIQERLTYLCRLRSSPLSDSLRKKIHTQQREVLDALGDHVVSEALFTPPQTYDEYTAWAVLAAAHGVELHTFDPDSHTSLSTRLVEIGRFFSAGTTCNCCLGWRVLISGLIGVGIGLLVGIVVL